MTPAEQIQQARKSAGLSQPAAAERLGLPLATLRNYEQDRRTPNAYTLRAILRDLERELGASTQTKGPPAPILAPGDPFHSE